MIFDKVWRIYFCHQWQWWINVSWLGSWDLCQVYNSFKFDNLTIKKISGAGQEGGVSVLNEDAANTSVLQVGKTRRNLVIHQVHCIGQPHWNVKELLILSDKNDRNNPPLIRNPISLFTSINHCFLTQARSGKPFSLSTWRLCEWVWNS